MLSKEDLELIEEVSPVLKDYLLVSINEGINSMLDIIDAGKNDYNAFFETVDKNEAKEMFNFIEDVALPFYTEKEMFEYSSKCKKISDLLTKYKGLKKN